MADDEQKPIGSTARAGRGRRRPAPTLDLTATEVAAPEPDPVIASPNPAEPESPESAATNGSLPPPPRAVALWPLLGAAVGGGVVVAIVMLLVLGFLPRDADPGRETARLAALEASLRELSARPQPITDNGKAAAAMAERLAALEAAAKAPRAPFVDAALSERLAAAEKRIGAVSDEAAALKRQSEAATAAAETAQRRADAAATTAETVQAVGAQGTAAERQDIAAQSARLTALERSAQTLQAELAQQKTALADSQALLTKQNDARTAERTVRLAIVAEMLKAAVARGDRFRTELDTAKALAGDAAALAPLEGFADSGVPTAPTLAQRLRAVLPAMRLAAEPDATSDAGFLKRLQVNAERLVRIQPIGEQHGDDAVTILARIEAKAARGDMTGVQAELARLPPAVRAPAADWIKAAQARDAAIGASQRFAAAHLGALAGRPD